MSIPSLVKVSFCRLAGLGPLAVACAIGLASAATGVPDTDTAKSKARDIASDYSSWAVSPAAPGANLPPAGRSLFDFLFTESGPGETQYNIPFPFSALIERVASQLGNREFMGGIRVAIIPMGRSLQRAAAAPEFFKYPRTVIAVTGEPRTNATDAGMLLKDRLYIAYVEKTATLEVISYNEAAGRFEFQLVKHYRDSARPDVFYADRAICISCHQNHAPIFSLPTWRETNANGTIADQLVVYGTDMHLSPQANIDFPDDFEKATLRANELVTLQTVWQQGCADEHDVVRSRRCRAAAFSAILQYGLTGKRDFDSNAPRYRSDFIETFNRTWSRKWPQGLSVAQSSIPDRNPFGGDIASYGGTSSAQAEFDWKRAVNVTPAFDPLTPRPPREIWRFAGAMDTSRVIAGWANSFAPADFRTLDRVLVQGGNDTNTQRATYRAQCTVRQLPSSTLNLTCTADPRAELPLNLVAQVDRKGNGRIDWMNFGPAGTLRDVILTGSPPEASDQYTELRAAPKKVALTTRLPDGRRLAGVEIRLSASVEEASGAGIEAIVIDDFAPVNRAIEQLLQERPALFDNVPLMRAKLMPALLAKLPATESSAGQHWCCADANAMPAAMIEGPEVDATVLADENLQPFFRYCAMCHFTAEQFPPNFLSGKAQRVEKNLRHCAPRMLVRLSAWNRAGDERVKSPMPPETALPALGITAEAWKTSKELQQLQAYVQQLARKTGPPSDDPAAIKEGYEGLPSCLPPAQ